MKPRRLITIIREDLIPGYQIAQTAHSVANYCIVYRNEAIQWHVEGNYIISLSVTDEKSLKKLFKQIRATDTKATMFYEPDISQHTSIAFVANDKTDLLTQYLPLAGATSGTIDKDTPQAVPQQ